MATLGYSDTVIGKRSAASAHAQALGAVSEVYVEPGGLLPIACAAQLLKSDGHDALARRLRSSARARGLWFIRMFCLRRMFDGRSRTQAIRLRLLRRQGSLLTTRPLLGMRRLFNTWACTLTSPITWSPATSRTASGSSTLFCCCLAWRPRPRQ